MILVPENINFNTGCQGIDNINGAWGKMRSAWRDRPGLGLLGARHGLLGAHAGLGAAHGWGAVRTAKQLEPKSLRFVLHTPLKINLQKIDPSGNRSGRPLQKYKFHILASVQPFS